MSSSEIKNSKEVVKAKHGQAALRATSEGSSCMGAAPPSMTAATQSRPTGMTYPRSASFPSKLCSLSSAAAIRLHWQSSIPAKSRSIWGSGGGIGGPLSARCVGPTGKACGLDMTDEMLALANENKRKSGTENVSFLKGEIENIPLPDNSVGVISSNWVINLSAAMDMVLCQAFRVLKPGGRLAVSDVVTRGEISPKVRESVLL